MLEELIVPRLDQGMEEGLVAAWLVEQGDSIDAGDPIVEIETDKVSTELEAPVGGTVLRIDVEAGERVPVGTVIAWIGDGAEDPPDPTSTPDAVGSEGPSDTKEPEQGADVPVEAVVTDEDRAVALPIDRTEWRRPHAQSPRERFESNVAATSSAPASEADRQPLDAVRRAVATTVTRSWKIPQFDVYVDVEFSAASDLIEHWRNSGGMPRVTVTDLLLAAIGRAVEAEPAVNAWYEDGHITSFDHVDVTMLTQTERGLVMPRIRDVARQGISALSAERRRVAESARDNRLAPDDLATGTIALSNLGGFRIHRFNALLVPPQVAVLAIGRARDTSSGPLLGVTLTVDHRAVDGAAAARYLEALADLVSDPTLLLL